MSEHIFPGFRVERFYLGCLAHASYCVFCETSKVAYIVEPRWGDTLRVVSLFVLLQTRIQFLPSGRSYCALDTQKGFRNVRMSGAYDPKLRMSRAHDPKLRTLTKTHSIWSLARIPFEERSPSSLKNVMLF